MMKVSAAHAAPDTDADAVTNNMDNQDKDNEKNKALPDLDPWPLTIATYNIHGAVGTDGHFLPQRIAGVLQEMNADIIALQEVPLGGNGFPNVLSILQHATGFHAAAGLTFSVSDQHFGNAVLSRYPICETRSINLSFGNREPRGALDADVDCHGHPLRVVATHLGLQVAERRSQIRQLLRAFDTDQMPVILLGDINEWFIWGKSLAQLESHFEQVPAHATFPSRYPLFALDRIWIRPRHRLVQVNAHATVLARVASDHLPLVAHIDG